MTASAYGTKDGSPQRSTWDEVTFENECVDLLCRQDKWLTLLERAKEKEGEVAALQFAKQMLVEFLLFAEPRLPDEDFTEVTRRVDHAFKETSMLERRSYPSFAVRLRAWFGLERNHTPALMQGYETLGKEFRHLVTFYFACCVRQFDRQVSFQKDFIQSVDCFVGEMKYRW